MEKNINGNKKIIAFGLVIAIIGLTLLSYNYLQGKVLKAYNQMNLQILALNSDQSTSDKHDKEKPVETIKENEISNDDPKTNHSKVSTKPSINYIARLSIPKISLDHGLVAMASKYNSVDYGIETIKGSTYPNVNNGNLILASHSGTSYRSIFKNLYKLNIGDHCYIEYAGKTYTYQITKIYNKPKIGKVTIDRNYQKTTLTLITCTKNSAKEQTIYILELI